MSKILLVEDQKAIRDLLSWYLQRWGFEVIAAVNGEQGIRMAQSEAPDLILMEMGLPVLDGWEATLLLKAAPRTRSIPIIGFRSQYFLTLALLVTVVSGAAISKIST